MAAIAEVKLAVSLEAIAHNALAETAQIISHEHGLVLHSVQFDWHVDISGKHTLMRVQAVTESQPRPRKDAAGTAA